MEEINAFLRDLNTGEKKLMMVKKALNNPMLGLIRLSVTAVAIIGIISVVYLLGELTERLVPGLSLAMKSIVASAFIIAPLLICNLILDYRDAKRLFAYGWINNTGSTQKYRSVSVKYMSGNIGWDINPRTVDWSDNASDPVNEYKIYRRW
jgi:hypothetical protein